MLILPLFILSDFVGYAHAMTQSDLKDIREHHPHYAAVDTCSVADTGASSVESGTTEENKKIIWQYLMGKGLTAEQTAGIMGNLQAEGGFEPRRVEYGPPWKNSRGEISLAGTPSSLDDNVPPDQDPKSGAPGYGIVQWTWPTRKQGLRDLAKERGVKASDLGMQLDYLWKELSVSIIKPLQKATTIEEASKIIVLQYEGPTGKETAAVQDKRAGLGKDIYKQFVGTDPGVYIASSPTAGCGTSAGNTGVVDCTSASGNAKIVCAAQQNFGNVYCPDTSINAGKCGHNPEKWVADVQANGKIQPYFSTECSGFVNVALYQAFNVKFDYCSSGYAKDTKNFTVIPTDTVQPGDLLIEHINQGCGDTNHVAIVESYDPATGKLVTLESTSDRNDAGKDHASGRLSWRNLSFFDGAVRYIGQGTGQ